MARLGDTTLQRKIIANCSVNNTLESDDWLEDFNAKFFKLVFINTQESVCQLNQWIDSTHQFTVTSSGSSGWAADRVISYIQEIILNKEFRQLTKNVSDIGFDKYSGEFLMQVKNWIINNKGKYKINQEYHVFDLIK